MAKKKAKKKASPAKAGKKKSPAKAGKAKKSPAKKKNNKAGKKVKAKRGKKQSGPNFMGLIIAVVIIASVVLFAKFKGGTPLKYVKSDKLGEWSATGNDFTGKLNSPRGMSVSPDDHLYVADIRNSRIVKFRLNGEYVFSIGGVKGDKKGQFNEPSGVAVDKQGFVYVADSWNGRICKFDSSGKYITEIGGPKGGFYSPRNVNVNEYGVVYVADTGTSRVHRFDTEFHRIGKPFGERGKSFGNFNEVFGLAFDSQKRVYVGDPGNRRVNILSSDLRPLAQIEVKGWQEAAPMWPQVAVDSNDRLYCVSSGTKEIYVYDTKSPKFKYIGTIKMDRNNKELFTNPVGIAIDRENNLYISDVAKNSVVKLKPELN